jgi:peptidoglycan-associated lipoprotein
LAADITGPRMHAHPGATKKEIPMKNLDCHSTTPVRRATFALPGALLLAALVAGCGSSVKLDDKPPVESRAGTPVGPGGAASGTAANAGQGTAQTQVTTVDLGKGAADGAGAVGRVVYFDFDSFVVKDEFRTVVESHAKALASTKAKRMVVEGHTDERGGREYNLALGQKRAEAVAKSMALLGAGAAQVEAVSYGEERPAAEGHDEAAWAKNRRAELKDK